MIIVFLLFTLCIAQSPTCGTSSDYSLSVANVPWTFGEVLLYKFPTRSFSASFIITGAINNSAGVADLFDFYILNNSQYHQSPATWEHIQSCTMLDTDCSLNVTCGSLTKTTFTDSRAGTHLALFFACRNPSVGCDIWLNVTLEGIGPDCALDCPSYDLGNGVCNPACYNTACQDDLNDCFTHSCAASCPIGDYANGVCDFGCNNADCNFDGGDCATPCAVGCTANLIGNGVCNSACNNAACSYDDNDCRQITNTATSRSPSSSPNVATNRASPRRVF